MNVEAILATKENANIIKNMYPLYLYDLSEIYGNVPNEYGIYEEGIEPIKTLEEQYDIQNPWFEHPGILFPYITIVDNRLAGFCLVSTKQFAPKDVDYHVMEYFLLRPYRGRKIAEIAVKQIFSKHLGKWEVYTNPTSKNVRGQKFWHKTVSNYTLGNFQEFFGTTYDGEKLIFRFDNRSK